MSIQKISIKQKLILIILGLFLSVILLEIGLRMGGFVLLSLQEYRDRISIKQRGTYRIMCLGGSTTAMGGKDSHPSQLQGILNQRDIGIKFSVINKGIVGADTGAIVLQLEDNLNKYNPDMVITMMGINDGEITIAYEDIPASKAILFFKAFRTYKLAKLLWRHIKNKAQEIGIYKEKEDLNVRTDDSTQPGSYQELEKTCKKAIEVDPGKVKPYFELGWHYKYREKYDQAEEIFKKAIEMNPRDVKTYIELGWYYKDQGKDDKTEEMFKKAIEINSEKDRVYVNLGWWYRDQGKYDQAEEIFKKAIEINPKNYEAYLGLGWYYKDQGKDDKTEEMFKKAIELNSENDWVYVDLGWLYEDQGKYDQAEEMFKKAVEIIPESDRLISILALLYEKQGKNKSAEEYFKKANRLRLGTYNPATRYNYQRLKEIVTRRGIKLVCVQYPVRSIEPLKKMLKPHDGIIFVDNERVFKEAVKQASYEDYFMDSFGGDFGHCTKKGNRLLAENIADVILKGCFK